MKTLLHLSTTNKYLDWFDDNWDEIQALLDKNQFSGVELGLTLDYDIKNIPSGVVRGIHLSFYPMWLDFWRGDLEVVKQQLGSMEAVESYYGGLDRQVMIDNYKKQYERAKLLGVEYMVFHVSHVNIEDSFTFEYDYTDKDVIDATIELINEVFTDEDGPMLLFENLWWPGLTYMDKAMCERLLEKVNYKNTGFVLDVSHLILMNKTIDNEQKCYEHIERVVRNLGELKDRIHVVHLNKTLPKHYMRQDHKYKLERYKQTKNPVQKNRILMDHIHKMDVHQPFDHPLAKKIVACIDPKYCLYETNPSAPHELNYFIKKQNKALGIE